MLANALSRLGADRARILCQLGTVPVRLRDLTEDLGDRPIFIRRAISELIDDGWPIHGNHVSGFTLNWDRSANHEAMRGELEVWGNRLYGNRECE